MIGREEELNRTIQILCRKTKNNPLHVGDPGVGKTVLTAGLAMRIAKGQVPANLEDAEIFSLNMTAVIAGAKFRGDFEERINKILEELSKLKNPILFIDEIHTLSTGASSANGGMDAARCGRDHRSALFCAPFSVRKAARFVFVSYLGDPNGDRLEKWSRKV